MKTKNIITIITAGTLYVISFPPFDYKFFMYLSLIAFSYVSLTSSRSNSITISVLFGLIVYAFGTSWVFNSIYFYGGENIFVSLLMTTLFVVLQSSYFALYGYFINKDLYEKNNYYLVLLPPSLWVLIEFIRSIIFGGFPWLLVGTSQIHTIYNNFFPMGGTFLITFIVVLISNLTCVILMTNFRKKYIVVLSILSSFILLQINLNFSWVEKLKQRTSISIIQPNISQNIKFSQKDLSNLKNKYVKYTTSTSYDLVVLPETALPIIYDPNDDFFEKNILQESKNLVTGIFRIDAHGNIYNSMLLLDNKKKYYDKRHLVPFGEYTPFKSIFTPLANILNIPMSNLSSGSKDQIGFDLENYFISTIICYESGFPSLVAIPESKYSVILTVSNDSWFGDSFAPYQHLQIAQVRALENQRHLIRAANTGISAHIDEKGRLVTTIGLNKEGAIESHFHSLKGMTPYSRFGDYPILMLIFIIIILYLLRYRIYEKRI